MSTKLKKKKRNIIISKTRSPIETAAEAFVGGESLTTLFRNATTWFKGKKGKFRRAIIAQLGGKEKYREVSESHASTRVRFGGRRARSGPAITIDDSNVKRLNGSKLRWTLDPAIQQNILERYRDYGRRLRSDEKLPRGSRTALRDVRRSLKAEALASRDGCWYREPLYEPITVRIKTADGPADVHWRKLKATIYVSPKGNRYVEARTNEKTSLIISMPKNEFRKEIRLRRFDDSGIARRMSEEQEMVQRGREALKRKRKARREKKLARKKLKSSTRSKR